MVKSCDLTSAHDNGCYIRRCCMLRWQFQLKVNMLVGSWGRATRPLRTAMDSSHTGLLHRWNRWREHDRKRHVLPYNCEVLVADWKWIKGIFGFNYYSMLFPWALDDCRLCTVVKQHSRTLRERRSCIMLGEDSVGAGARDCMCSMMQLVLLKQSLLVFEIFPTSACTGRSRSLVSPQLQTMLRFGPPTLIECDGRIHDPLM